MEKHNQISKKLNSDGRNAEYTTISNLFIGKIFNFYRGYLLGGNGKGKPPHPQFAYTKACVLKTAKANKLVFIVFILLCEILLECDKLCCTLNERLRMSMLLYQIK